MALQDVHRTGIIAGDATSFAAWLAGAEPRVRASLRSFAASVLLRQAMRIARNLAIDDVRRRRLDVPIGTDGDGDELEDPAPGGPGDPLLRAAIQRCLSLLKGRPREALLARLADQGSSPDAVVCRSLGMAVNAFLQNVVRARRQVGECLQRHGVELAEMLR